MIRIDRRTASPASRLAPVTILLPDHLVREGHAEDADHGDRILSLGVDDRILEEEENTSRVRARRALIRTQ